MIRRYQKPQKGKKNLTDKLTSVKRSNIIYH